MGVFRNLREKLRDQTRDELCICLRDIGLDAQMRERGRTEEIVGGRVGGKSLGLIEIHGSPIRWVNVLRRRETGNAYTGGSTTYTTVYIVPDPRLGPDSPETQIETVRVKTFPLFGKVVDLHWEGWDSDLGIIGRLNSDHQLKQPIMDSLDVTIAAIPVYSCWRLSSVTRDSPSRELWNCYAAIAQHLLAGWSPNHGVK